ncbi:MAG TPA: methylated-DNA--[protein]-cysteine S-methyltransferase [Verrucomicrobiae bacterium]|jgi:O-6-methylguanine DNA methyltransferase
MKNNFVELPVSTPAGRFTARYSDKGLVELDWPNDSRRSRGNEALISSDRDSSRRLLQAKKWHRVTESALKTVLAGNQPKKLPPMALVGTEFQKSVWRQMLKISCGKTKSYGEIAQAIGKPKAVRAVGGACGANPIPVLVPCHRVLAANKKIGGFSGGLDWKRDLLSREGVKV